MPRKYIRKCPDRKTCTNEQIEACKKLMKEGKSKRAAADIVGIDESTLRKRLRLNCVASSMGRFKPTFTTEQEDEIYNYCKQNDEMFYGLTLPTLRKVVYEFAEINNIDHRFNKTTKLAGKDWVYEFLGRHPDLALRQTTPTSIARAIGFNEVQVKRFYSNLAECQDKYNFPPGRMYNMDETGLSTVPKKTPKVISLKGKKNVNKIVSGERGQTITAVCCVSATGNYVPPAFIFPRKRMKGELMDGAPAGSVGMTSDSGFINTELYLNWLQHFKDYVSPTEDSPVLLIIDNHSSHLSLQATLFCRKSGIVVLTLPPHCSHKLQPLDRAFFSPLKGQYSIEADRWMAQHPGRAINQYQVASIFDKAFKKVANVGNATSAFKVTGIYPFDDSLFNEADFAPSSVTDMYSVPAPATDYITSTAGSSTVSMEQRTDMHRTVIDTEVNAQESCQPIQVPISSGSSKILSDLVNKQNTQHSQRLSPSILDQIECADDFSSIFVEINDTATHEILIAAENREKQSRSLQPGPSNITLVTEILDQIECSSNILPIVVERDDTVTPEIVITVDNEEKQSRSPQPGPSNITLITEIQDKPDKTQNSSSSLHNNKSDIVSHVSLVDLSPLPKAVHVQKRRGNASRSEIVTASPYKIKLEEKEKEKENKAAKVRKPKLNIKVEKGNKALKVSELNIKVEKKINKERKCREEKNIKKRFGKQMLKPNTEVEYFCPLCKEKYEEPPTEEWIECPVCKSWWHENCTDFENGKFTCDHSL